MMKDKIFYSICFGFIFGVLLRSFISVDLYFTLFVLLISVFLILFFSLISKSRAFLLLFIFVAFFSVGVYRYHVVDSKLVDVFTDGVDQKVSLTGVIVDEPDNRENNMKLLVRTNIEGNEVKILVTVNLGEDFKYGDSIQFSGKLSKPENFTTDTGKEFDYINYLRKDGILYSMSYGNVEVVSRGGGSVIKRHLFAFKGKFLEKISYAIPSPESLLMGGLILGERSAFDAETRQKFIDTGTIHIIALSGYNVTIVAEWIMKAFAFLPRNFGFGFGILGILLFVIMSGGASTAVRAGMMAVLALVARATGRTYDVGRALILAGVGMVVFNPFVLVYDVSFQLSFIATVAVIYLAPKLEKYFLWVTERFGVRDVISVTFSAYIFVLPFILYKMGNLSLVALPANVLVLPFIPFTMMLGFLTGFVGFLSYTLAVPVGYLSYFLLHYELWIIDVFSRFSFASFAIPNFPLWLAVLIYAYFVYRLFSEDIKKIFIKPGENYSQ